MKLILKLLLAPFSLLYLGITAIRNIMFDKGLFKSYKSKHFSIGVGNLSVGGAGKSPFIKYLSQLDIFQNPAILSRGYGRETKGFLEVTNESTANQVGDEPKMLSQYAKAYVCEKRVLGDQQIPMSHDVLLLDDVFQHRHIQPHINILVTEYHRLFTQDWPMPSGRLREWRSGAKRADIIIVSKCPELNASQIEEKKAELRKSGNTASVFFCKYINSVATNNKGQELMAAVKVIAFAGLASNASFESYCREHFQVVAFHSFKDHHNYTAENLKTIFNNSYDLKFITSAKDYVKIKDICSSEVLENIYYTDTSVEFINDEHHFQNIIKSAYESFHKL